LMIPGITASESVCDFFLIITAAFDGCVTTTAHWLLLIPAEFVLTISSLSVSFRHGKIRYAVAFISCRILCLLCWCDCSPSEHGTWLRFLAAECHVNHVAPIAPFQNPKHLWTNTFVCNCISLLLNLVPTVRLRWSSDTWALRGLSQL